MEVLQAVMGLQLLPVRNAQVESLVRKLIGELVDYPPSRHWRKVTIDIWLLLRFTRELNPCAPRSMQLLPWKDFITVGEDVHRTTGFTCWMTADPPRFMFAGVWFEPDHTTLPSEAIVTKQLTSQGNADATH